MHRIDESSLFNCMHRLKGWHLIKRIVLSHRVTFRSFSGKIFSMFAAILLLHTDTITTTTITTTNRL